MRTSPTGRNSHPRGLTLVELCVVIALIAVLAAVAAPAFSGFYRANAVRACAWQVTALARRARDYAICRAVRAGIAYDERERQFRLLADSADAPGQWQAPALAGAQPVKVPDPVPMVSVTIEGQPAAAGSPIVFFPDGQALSGVIVLEAEDGRAISVETTSLTGRTRVVQGDVREGG